MPICSHTMQNPGQKDIFYCPRCGTMRVGEMVSIPKLVEYVRDAIDSSIQIKVEGIGIHYVVYTKFWVNIKESVGKI